MNSKKLHRWYMKVLSGYTEAMESGQIGKDDLIIKEGGKIKTIQVPISKGEHIGPRMSIDEKTIDGNCYTILSNRDTNKIALMAKTLKTKYLSKLLKDVQKNMEVRSLTRDMAINYDWLGRSVFMNAYHVIDKFHVIKHALDALQAIRIRHRQEELSKRRKAKQKKIKYEEHIHSNGDTSLQLLARSRGLLYKNKKEWTDQQAQRAKILFAEFEDIKQGYKHIRRLRQWFIAPKSKTTYQTTQEKKANQFAEIIDNFRNSSIDEIQNLSYTLNKNSAQIIHYFKSKETNAKAEALNRNIQRFINVNYGARNSEFFMFRLAKQFA